VSTGGTAPVPVTFNLGGGLGGSAIHHYANWYRLHPEDFKEQSLFGQNLDWPITYDDLRPFYDEVQTELGLSGDTQAETTRPPSAPYPMPALRSTSQAEVISRGFANLGIGSFPRHTPSTRLSTEGGMPVFMMDGVMRAAQSAHWPTRLSPTFRPPLPPVPSFAPGRT
jgi:choline dehydrogenase-like flavoprotein